MTSTSKKNREPASYRQRTYRRQIDPDGLESFTVQIRETDLHILTDRELREETTRLVLEERSGLESYIRSRPEFLTSLAPLAGDPLAPAIAKEMLRVAALTGVGPMAAVAGAMAERVGQGLLAAGTAEVMVENGGDIFLQRLRDCRIALFAGTSPLSNRLGIKITKRQMPIGVCTSSGTVGHSLSLGRADSVTVLSPSTALADAAATRICNEVRKKGDINRALEIGRAIIGIAGIVIIHQGEIGAWGEVELVSLE